MWSYFSFPQTLFPIKFSSCLHIRPTWHQYPSVQLFIFSPCLGKHFFSFLTLPTLIPIPHLCCQPDLHASKSPQTPTQTLLLESRIASAQKLPGLPIAFTIMLSKSTGSALCKEDLWRVFHVPLSTSFLFHLPGTWLLFSRSSPARIQASHLYANNRKRRSRREEGTHLMGPSIHPFQLQLTAHRPQSHGSWEWGV